MNIGIDLDGVLTNIQSFNLKYAPQFFEQKFNRVVVDESQYDIRDIFRCTEDEYLAYWKKHLFIYAIMEPARKEAKAFIDKLYADGHKIFIITKRVLTCKNNAIGVFMRFLVRTWLWCSGLKYQEIVFCDNDIPDSKKAACIKKHIDIMIDDETVNIYAIAPVATVICFDASYNRGCEGENIYRAQNFDQAYGLIKDIVQQ